MPSQLLRLVNLTLKVFELKTTVHHQSQIKTSIIKSQSHYVKLCTLLQDLTLNDIHFTLISDLNEHLNEFNNSTANDKLTIQTAVNSDELSNFIIANSRDKITTRQDYVRLRNVLAYLNSTAPVLCVNIYETSLATLSLFLIRKGATLPLHNHPYMNGIIKVLYGSGCMNSYTPISGDESSLTITAKHESCKVIKSTDQDLLHVRPNEENIHEIKASDNEDLIFLDIITPSYEDNNCEYYRVVPSNNDKLVCLKKITTPSTYFCDTLMLNEILQIT